MGLKEIVREAVQSVLDVKKPSATDQVSVFGVGRAMGCLLGPFVDLQDTIEDSFKKEMVRNAVQYTTTTQQQLELLVSVSSFT